MLKSTVVPTSTTVIVIRIGIHGGVKGMVWIRIRGHESAVVIPGYGTHEP